MQEIIGMISVDKVINNVIDYFKSMENVGV